MAHSSFSEAIQMTMDLIVQATARIEQNHGEPDELHNMRAHLVELLRLMERSPGIDAAADDLDAAATGLVLTNSADGAGALARRRRLLREALLRFQQRVASAKPSEKAKRMGLT
jgi:hypothetical protein